VEAISLDEAFLDMTGAEPLFGDPAAIGRKLKQAVREATGGLTASVGLSGTKYVAKVASAHCKPDGLTLVAPEEAPAWLAPFPVSRLWGVGPKTEARLHRLGLKLIGDVAAADPDFLAAALGSAGRDFHDLANGRDPRPVTGARAAKSIGSEATLERDVSDRDELRLHLRRAAEKVGARLRYKGLVASGVRVKLKTADFRSLTRQRHLRQPTDVADSLYTAASELLDAFDHPGPFRLVGVAAFDLAPAGETGQMDLFAAAPARSRGLEMAIDDLTGRYGVDVLRRAEDLQRGRRTRITPNLDFLDREDGEDEAESGG
jgi:DNA polymerase-4